MTNDHFSKIYLINIDLSQYTKETLELLQMKYTKHKKDFPHFFWMRFLKNETAITTYEETIFEIDKG